jgi:hypothetical protein
LGLSCVLLELAAVGRIMRSRKPPLGAALAVEARESGRLGAGGASDAREVFGATAFGAGRVVVDGLRVTLGSSPCLAAEAAVGAVKRAGRPTGRVGDLGVGFLKPVGEVL